MRNRVLLVLLVMGTVSIVALAQTPEKQSYDLSEVQKLRLELKQKEAQMAQQTVSFSQAQSQQAQAQFEQAVAEMNKEIKSIEKENSWPDNLVVDKNFQFKDPPAKPATTPAKNEDPKPAIPMDKPVGPRVSPARKQPK